MKSQNGYPVLDAVEDCKVYTINANNDVRLPLSPRPPGEAIALFMRRFDKHVEPLNRNETWGYNKRKVGNSEEWSNHASGTAADANSLKHPQRATNTFEPEQVEKIRRILDDFDGVIKWGGDYRVTKDEMHFEIVGTYTAVNLVVRRLKRYGKVYLSRLLPGKRNLDVYMVKRVLHKAGYDVGTLNNYFGAGLTRALRKYQNDNRLNVNGAADTKTLEHLGFKPQ